MVINVFFCGFGELLGNSQVTTTIPAWKWCLPCSCSWFVRHQEWPFSSELESVGLSLSLPLMLMFLSTELCIWVFDQVFGKHLVFPMLSHVLHSCQTASVRWHWGIFCLSCLFAILSLMMVLVILTFLAKVLVDHCLMPFPSPLSFSFSEASFVAFRYQCLFHFGSTVVSDFLLSQENSFSSFSSGVLLVTNDFVGFQKGPLEV